MQNRQRLALEYALKYLRISEIKEYISDIILYGSVARREERFKSDVDLLIVLKDCFPETYEAKKKIRHTISDLGDPWTIFEMVEDHYGKTDNDPNYIAEVEARIITKSLYETANSTFYKVVKREGISVWTH